MGSVSVGKNSIDIKILFRTKSEMQFVQEVKEKCIPYFKHAAESIADRAAMLCPVQMPPDDVVIMRENITGKAFGKRAKSIGFKVRTNTKDDDASGYGAHVEFGTSHARPVKFLYPAFNEGMPALMRDLENIL